MKKIILTIVAVFAFGLANAQDGKFKLGVNLGLPMGDIKDAYSFAIGVDAAYLWSVGDGFQAGVTTGYAHYMGKEDWIDDAGFVPVAGTAQYSFTDNFFGGLDLGYALGVSPSGNDGGFLYQPKVGYQAEKYEVYAGYKGISVDGGTFSSINLGFNYKF
ncbi:hypothetical protein [Flavobacterium solisilvae]|uniref:Outer membrane protein beta-barrel domain-containing protein n=1 Tax=Flavobacterium solisilvae TaxID=1852019 RepID=A0ABX1QQT4_9FLAO|nr:hypothetical protein [Flavobacterium solisilvae]NMH24511.1 hypothetical protein [Flavobacterium solisilvae]